jgi:hypothetical protein
LIDVAGYCRFVRRKDVARLSIFSSHDLFFRVLRPDWQVGGGWHGIKHNNRRESVDDVEHHSLSGGRIE